MKPKEWRVFTPPDRDNPGRSPGGFCRRHSHVNGDPEIAGDRGLIGDLADAEARIIALETTLSAAVVSAQATQSELETGISRTQGLLESLVDQAGAARDDLKAANERIDRGEGYGATAWRTFARFMAALVGRDLEASERDAAFGASIVLAFAVALHALLELMAQQIGKKPRGARELSQRAPRPWRGLLNEIPDAVRYALLGERVVYDIPSQVVRTSRRELPKVLGPLRNAASNITHAAARRAGVDLAQLTAAPAERKEESQEKSQGAIDRPAAVVREGRPKTAPESGLITAAGRVGELEAEVSDLRAQLDAAAADAAGLGGAIAERDEARAQLADAVAAQHLAEDQLAEALDAAEELRAALNATIAERDEVRELLDDPGAADLSADIAALRAELSSANTEIERLRAEAQTAQIDTLEPDLAEIDPDAAEFSIGGVGIGAPLIRDADVSATFSPADQWAKEHANRPPGRRAEATIALSHDGVVTASERVRSIINKVETAKRNRAITLGNKFVAMKDENGDPLFDSRRQAQTAAWRAINEGHASRLETAKEEATDDQLQELARRMRGNNEAA